MAGSYLFSATREGFAGGPFHEVNQSESLHYVQPLMAEGSERERVTDTERDRKWLYNQFKLCLCFLPQSILFLL